MLRADGPAEGDDSKETNTAVANPVTEWESVLEGALSEGGLNLRLLLRPRAQLGVQNSTASRVGSLSGSSFKFCERPRTMVRVASEDYDLAIRTW